MRLGLNENHGGISEICNLRGERGKAGWVPKKKKSGQYGIGFRSFGEK